MIKPFIYLSMLSLILSLLIVGCDDQQQLHNLKNYVSQLKQKIAQTPKKEIASEFNLPPPVKFGTGETTGGLAKSQGNAAHPLQGYPLKSLQFVGIVTQNHQTSAYLMTPDGMIYQAKEGEIIGDSYGKIIKIDSEHIEVLQKTGSSVSRQQVITLQLKE